VGELLKMINWISDLGSNHNGSLPRTKKLINEAKKAGCTAVKLQLFNENLYHPDFKQQRKDLKKKTFPAKYLNEVSTYCRDIGIKFGCTPFSLSAVDILFPYVDFYKIGSYENQWDDLIKKVQSTGKPWQISTGMMELITVRRFVESKAILRKPPEAIYRCSSVYPAIHKNCSMYDIRFCKNYLNNYQNKIGWSDHTKEPGVIYQSVNQGAKFIEFHLDLEDKKGWESSFGHCWTPKEIKNVIRGVRISQESILCHDKNYDSEAKKWKVDPTDGMRPLKKFREELLNEQRNDK